MGFQFRQWLLCLIGNSIHIRFYTVTLLLTLHWYRHRYRKNAVNGFIVCMCVHKEKICLLYTAWTLPFCWLQHFPKLSELDNSLLVKNEVSTNLQDWNIPTSYIKCGYQILQQLSLVHLEMKNNLYTETYCITTFDTAIII